MEIGSNHITAYIDHLKNIGYTVTLHGKSIGSSVFIEYNYHCNPYCHYIKTVYGNWNECIYHQKKVENVCNEGSFFGCCYAGMGEFVYPVKKGDELLCFISVSGYLAPSSAEKSKHFAEKHLINFSEVSSLINKYLCDDLPKKQNVDAVILPLVFMLENYFSSNFPEKNNESLLYHKILRYIGENCHSKITMSHLSRHFNYSVSTLSHLFLKNSGKSLPEYIDDLRMTEAKWYLSNSKTPIAEISYFLGYNSSNYFSTVFKKKNGITPRQYRQTADIVALPCG